jgi:dTDP-glucose 4,6-dehydratase
MKLVTITGCLGLIGHYVTRKCLERGWKVYGIDSLTYAANEDFLYDFREFNTPTQENFTFINQDICELSFLPDCDYVINVAAESHVGNSIIDSVDFLRTNVDGVRNLLDLIRNKPSNIANSPIFFHFSTDEVYGDIEHGAFTESALLNPSNPYAASKAGADMLILAWARTYGVQYNILRPTNNYGIGQYPEKLIPVSVKLLQRGKKIRLHNAGEPVRNWLHADDTAEAVMTIIEKGTVNEIYNVAGNLQQANRDTVKKIINTFFENKYNWEEYVDLSYVREGQDVRYALNDEKLRELGWDNKKNFDDELPTLIQYCKQNFKW